MVVAVTSPAHNQPKTAIGYNEANGYSIGLPFWDDSSGKREVRLDFVEFSHADARLIAAAPDLLKALEECQRFLNDLTDPDKKASGPNIIASFGNALALNGRVHAALSSARATGGTE